MRNRKLVSKILPTSLAFVFILGYFIVMLIGISWGLPSQDRISMLIYGKEVTQIELQELTNQRRYCESHQSSSAMFYGGRSKAVVKEMIPEFPSECIESAALSFRRFIMYGTAQDESKVFQSLSRMKPKELDFHPKRFDNGTAFLYPIGGLLFLVEKLDLVKFTDSLEFYFNNPDQVRRIYLVGRIVSVLSVIGTLILLYQIGAKYQSKFTGLVSALGYGVVEQVFFLGLQTRMHVFLAFFVTLSLYYLFAYVQTSKSRYLVYASMALGIAVGSGLHAWTAWLLIPLLISSMNLESKTKLFRITLSGTLVLITFLITNPYVVIDFFGFTNYWIGAVTLYGMHGERGYTPSLVSSFHSVYSLILNKNISLSQIPFIAMVVLSVLWAVLAKQRPWRQLGIFVVVICLIFSLVGKSFGRMILFALPVICILSASLMLDIKTGLKKQKLVFWIVLMSVFFPGTALLASRSYNLLAHEVDRNWYKESVSCLQSLGIKRGHEIGLYEYPAPNTFPPFPFIGSQLILVPEVSDVDSPPNFVIVRRNEDKTLWETNQLRRHYNYACDIKGAYSPTFGYIEQIASFYKRK